MRVGYEPIMECAHAADVVTQSFKFMTVGYQWKYVYELKRTVGNVFAFSFSMAQRPACPNVQMWAQIEYAWVVVQ